MSNTNQNQKVNKREGNPIIGAAIFLLMVVAYVLSLVSPWIPPVIVSILFFKYHSKCQISIFNLAKDDYADIPAAWMLGLGYLTQATLYFAGYVTFKEIAGSHYENLSSLSVVINVATMAETWQHYYNIVLLGTLPVLSLYLIAVGVFFRRYSNKRDIAIVNKKFGIRYLFGLLNPFTFYYFGLVGRKLSWFVAGLVQSTPFWLMMYLDKHGHRNTECFQIALTSFLLMYGINFISMIFMKEEYLERSNTKNVVYVVNEDTGNLEREVHAA